MGFNGRQTGTAVVGAPEAPATVTHVSRTGGNAGSVTPLLSPPPEFLILLVI